MNGTDRRGNCCNQAKSNPLFDAYAFRQVRHHARKLVKQFLLPEDRQDDLQQDMLMFLCKAEKRYNPSKASSRTFVSRVLENFCRYFRRQESTRNRNGWKDIAGSDVAEDFSADDRAEGIEMLRLLVSGEQHQQLHSFIASLPDDHRKLCEALMQNTNKQAIADELGIAKSSLYRRLEKVREHFEKEEIENFFTN